MRSPGGVQTPKAHGSAAMVSFAEHRPKPEAWLLNAAGRMDFGAGIGAGPLGQARCLRNPPRFSILQRNGESARLGGGDLRRRPRPQAKGWREAPTRRGSRFTAGPLIAIVRRAIAELTRMADEHRHGWSPATIPHARQCVIDTPCPLYSRMCRLVSVPNVTVCTRI